MAKQVCDISASSGMSRGQSTEHLRDYKVTDPDAKKYGYYDPTRSPLNFEVTKGAVVSPVDKSNPIDKRFRDNCAARGIEIPKPIQQKDGTVKERNVIANFILGGSREKMLELAFGNQNVDLSKGADNSHLSRQKDIEEWAKDQYRLMGRLYGEENIIAFVVHLDEKNPHVHCTVIPEINGRISYNSTVGGKNKNEARERFKATHDAVAAVNAKWGLERGDDIRETGAHHRTSEEYWQWLRGECNKLEGNKNSLAEEITGLKDSLVLLNREVHKNEIKLKGLTTMVSNKMTVLNDLERQRQELSDAVLDETVSQMEAEQKTKQLETSILQSQDFLGRKRREIDQTKQLLELLKKQLEEKNKQILELDNKKIEIQRELSNLNDSKLEKLERDLNSDLGRHLLDMAPDIWEFLNEKVRSKLNAEDKINFDNFFNTTIIPEISEHGDEVFKTAAALFLGREEDAVDISVSAGGGGNPGSGWRKRNGEDDDQFRFRCIGTAVNMTRSQSRKIRR